MEFPPLPQGPGQARFLPRTAAGMSSVGPTLHATFVVCIFLFITIWCANAVSARAKIKQSLLIVGNFSLNGELVNIAQYDLSSKEWSLIFQTELSNIDSNGIIFDIVLNSTAVLPSSFYVYGSFDTITRTSQVQFCSIGSWNGNGFEKVGEGLCPRGSAEKSFETQIQAAIIGPGGDLFVGGSFESRVWDGHHFVDVYYVAQYHVLTSSWVPLCKKQLGLYSKTIPPKVLSLAWDEGRDILYIGGHFTSLDSVRISSGLALWTKDEGLQEFPTPGAYLDDAGNSEGIIQSIQFDQNSQTLFVSGLFNFIGNISCTSIAAWSRRSNEWLCLLDPTKEFSSVTSMLVHKNRVYLSGWVSASSDWSGKDWQAPYSVAVLNITDLVSMQQGDSSTNSSLPKSSLDPSTSTSKSPSSSSLQAKPWAQWSPIGKWSWLSNFSGANGPILKIIPGTASLENCIFIVGAFNNYDAILLWCNNSTSSEAVSIVSPPSIFGVVTSVAQIFEKIPDDPESNKDVVFFSSKNRMLIMTFLVAFVFLSTTVYVFMARFKDYPFFSDKKEASSNPQTFPLTILSNGSENIVNISSIFEKAMKARHMSFHDSLLLINPKEVEMSRIIGEGSFGRVWSGYWKKRPVAIKEFVLAQAALVGGSIDRDHIIEEIIGEAGVMAHLDHENILKLYGCSLTMQAIWIVIELCNRGSLRFLLNDKNTNLHLLTKLSLCLDICEGMKYLHIRDSPIIHRDLKSHNVFVIEKTPGNFIAKIGDWGSARAIALSGGKSMTQGVGTACWLAPEVINNSRFSMNSDVYAFGIVLWEIYTRQEVHEFLSAAQIIARVANEGLRPNIPVDCPWGNLMAQCWDENEVIRPNFSEISKMLSDLFFEMKSALRIQNPSVYHELVTKIRPSHPQSSPSHTAERVEQAINSIFNLSESQVTKTESDFPHVSSDSAIVPKKGIGKLALNIINNAGEECRQLIPPADAGGYDTT